jgi:hypothetical protein
MFVSAKRQMEADTASVHVYGTGYLGANPRPEAIAEIPQPILGCRA